MHTYIRDPVVVAIALIAVIAVVVAMAIATVSGKPLTVCALQRSNKRKAADATSTAQQQQPGRSQRNSHCKVDASGEPLAKIKLLF